MYATNSIHVWIIELEKRLSRVEGELKALKEDEAVAKEDDARKKDEATKKEKETQRTKLTTKDMVPR
jgi:outer membrane murein-binding lipoprotein Lpp